MQNNSEWHELELNKNNLRYMSNKKVRCIHVFKRSTTNSTSMKWWKINTFLCRNKNNNKLTIKKFSKIHDDMDTNFSDFPPKTNKCNALKCANNNRRNTYFSMFYVRRRNRYIFPFIYHFLWQFHLSLYYKRLDLPLIRLEVPPYSAL